MKMVKSLLLGTAAGLVAMSGAQAADLPVKAKPVQYVKICSLYGAGFYYIPGTDTCLKIGGWVRQYLGVNSNNNLTNGPLGTGELNTRAQNNGWAWKVRGYITADARTQTEWGTLRSYIAVGTNIQGTSGGQGAAGAAGVGTGGFNANRAFVQLAGFTFGVAQSFYDLYPAPALSYYGGMINPSTDTGDGGQTVTAYTAQFGGGLSATLSLEAPRTTAVYNTGLALPAANIISVPLGNSAISVRYPDVVANLRYDAPWGSAQVMGGIHDASGLYYGANTSTGNPTDAMGFFIGAGAKLFVPMAGPGDYFSFQVSYSQGATGYECAGCTFAGAAVPSAQAAGPMYLQYNGGAGGNVGWGIVSDGVYGNLLGGPAVGLQNVQLTTVFGVNAGYEHFWTKRWQTSLYGTYMSTKYNAVANALLCQAELFSVVAFPGQCNNNFEYWNVGSRTQFNIDSQTYVGLDVIYTQLNQHNAAVPGFSSGSGAQPVAVRSTTDQSAWIAEFRMHRNFYP